MQRAGIAIVAYGPQAWAQADQALDALAVSNPTLNVVVATDRLKLYKRPGVTTVRPDSDPYGRGAKLSVLDWSPFSHTLYLDADTRAVGELGGPFALLEGGWDMAITLSLRQGTDALGHLGAAERAATIDPATLALQAGVFYVANTLRTQALFRAWLEEWRRWGPLDQGALLRAYREHPVRLWLLGRPFNDGALVEHHYGAAARRQV